MKSYVFPGQGSQFPGMCNDLYQKHTFLKEMFNNAEDILGFNIAKIMFDGTKLLSSKLLFLVIFSSFFRIEIICCIKKKNN